MSRCAAPLVRYYSKMCDANNHAVREAACQGVAELAQKVGRHPAHAECLSPHVTTLLQVRRPSHPPPPTPPPLLGPALLPSRKNRSFVSCLTRLLPDFTMMNKK